MSDKTQQGHRRLPSTAWKPGQSGNPKGCPQGSRHKATIAAQALLDGDAEGLTRKCVEAALGGDMTAMRLCLERIVPVRKDRAVVLDLPVMETVADLPLVTAGIVAACVAGQITPPEAVALSGLVEGHRRAVETAEFEQRLAALEAKGEA